MTDDFSPITGRCMCGAVEVSAAEPFVGALYCHCTRCQRRSGTTRSMTALCPAGAFSVTAGEEKVRIWDPADGWLKAFCADCGSHTHDQPGRPQARGDPSGLPGRRPRHPPLGAPVRGLRLPARAAPRRRAARASRAAGDHRAALRPSTRPQPSATSASSRGQAAVDAAVRRASERSCSRLRTELGRAISLIADAVSLPGVDRAELRQARRWSATPEWPRLPSIAPTCARRLSRC